MIVALRKHNKTIERVYEELQQPVATTTTKDIQHIMYIPTNLHTLVTLPTQPQNRYYLFCAHNLNGFM